MIFRGLLFFQRPKNGSIDSLPLKKLIYRGDWYFKPPLNMPSIFKGVFIIEAFLEVIENSTQ
jgi:hypothetical protein